MYKCRFCKHIGIRTIHGLAICHDHSKSPVLESLIIDFYKKENELMDENYNSMKRKLSMVYTRPWKNLIEYYRVKWGLDK